MKYIYILYTMKYVKYEILYYIYDVFVSMFHTIYNLMKNYNIP